MAHQRRGLVNLTQNWVVLAQTLESAMASENASTHAQLRGILKVIKDARFLVKCCMYKLLLEEFSKLSLKFQNNDIMCFDVLPAVERSKGAIVDLLSAESSVEDLLSSVGMHLAGSTLTQRLPREGHMRKKVENREYLEVSYENMTHTTSLENFGNTIDGLKGKLSPKLSSCLEERTVCILQGPHLCSHALGGPCVLER